MSNNWSAFRMCCYRLSYPFMCLCIILTTFTTILTIGACSASAPPLVGLTCALASG